jgi:putative spermidine/putrescine transport system permease protein
VGVAPFFACALAFLLVPSGALLVGAFRTQDGEFTTAFIEDLAAGSSRDAYLETIEISLITALLGGILGFLIARAALSRGAPRFIRPVLMTFSGVAVNFGGIPLAFAFISTLGTAGLATRALDSIGLNPYDHGFTLAGFWGLVVTYLYFQIPLMILVIAPAIDGLRPEWRDAAANLGASSSQYWRRVGFPVLLPSIIGSMVLLFGASFGAYATAYALASGHVGLVSLEIGELISGNADPHQAYALAFGMVIVIAATMIIYFAIDRRASRWRRAVP